jgi:hypothetical protein
MNIWQFVPLVIILGFGMFFVWRSSGKKAGSSCGCGHCAHDHQGKQKDMPKSEPVN